MPWPPSSIFSLTLASVGFLPLFIFSRLKRPFRPGPIFFSVLSALWHTAHCWKTSLPFSASPFFSRSEEHTSELQSRLHLVCRLLLEKKKKKNLFAKIFAFVSEHD